MQTKTNRPSRGGRTTRHRKPFSRSTTGKKHTGTRGSRGFSRDQRHGNRGQHARKLPSFNPSQFINTNPVERVVEVYEPKHTFKTFGLSDRLVQAVTSLGIERPSPIQDQIIPHILNNRDVIGLAETGTGKTAAFLVPLIEKTLQSQNRQTLILVPTRELAIQLEDELRKLAKGTQLYSVVCVGGTNIRPQIQALRRKNHFVIGTPGRLLDLINRGKYNPQYVSTAVLDEADRMLDMGFVNDMRKILSHVPKNRETLLFSATMSKEADRLVSEFLNDPVKVSVKKKDVTNSIEQNVIPYKEDQKFETLASLLAGPEYERVIIFGAMKHSVEKLARKLSVHGIRAESLHGNKSHNQRQRSLHAFKGGKARVLVATDVAARGIHVDNVSHVINFDLPSTFEDYVHRIGRTGRADKRGKALTLIPA